MRIGGSTLTWSDRMADKVHQLCVQVAATLVTNRAGMAGNAGPCARASKFTSTSADELVSRDALS